VRRQRPGEWRDEPREDEQQRTGQQRAAGGERDRAQVAHAELADRVVARPEEDDQQQRGICATIVHSTGSALPYQGRPTGPRMPLTGRGRYFFFFFAFFLAIDSPPPHAAAAPVAC
jgi:hypothetical protein